MLQAWVSIACWYDFHFRSDIKIVNCGVFYLFAGREEKQKAREIMLHLLSCILKPNSFAFNLLWESPAPSRQSAGESHFTREQNCCADKDKRLKAIWGGVKVCQFSSSLVPACRDRPLSNVWGWMGIRSDFVCSTMTASHCALCRLIGPNLLHSQTLNASREAFMQRLAQWLRNEIICIKSVVIAGKELCLLDLFWFSFIPESWH